MKILRSALLLSWLLILWQPALHAEDKISQALQLFNKQSYAEALAAFEETKASGSAEARRLYYCALCYLHTARVGKGETLLRRICKDYPGSEAAVLAGKYLSAQATSAQVIAEQKKKDIPPIAVEASSPPDEIAVPFRKTAGGQVSVVAELQGRALNMIFDTGAEECLFGRNQIELANLSNAERSRTATLHSVSGPIRVFQIMADIKVGPFKKRLPVCVQDQPMETGILGQPFLQGYTCSIDNQAGLIRLRRRDAAAGPAIIDSFAIPFTLDGDKMIVSARLGGNPIDMCFDTGCFGVCLSKKQCERLQIRLPEPAPDRTPGPNGGRVPSWHIREDISLGPIMKTSFPIRVLESEISHPLLGQDFFGDRIYSIDREKKEIRFAR